MKDIIEKVCVKCGREKPVSSFKKDNRSNDGLDWFCNECENEHRRFYYSTYPQYKLTHLLRNRLWHALKGRQKTGSAIRDLGCTIDELVVYLSSHFQPGMTWDNWGYGPGKWNIDHIIPLVIFNLENHDQLLDACNYRNLQPLWSKDNGKKGSKLIN